MIIYFFMEKEEKIYSLRYRFSYFIRFATK